MRMIGLFKIDSFSTNHSSCLLKMVLIWFLVELQSRLFQHPLYQKVRLIRHRTTTYHSIARTRCRSPYNLTLVRTCILSYIRVSFAYDLLVQFDPNVVFGQSEHFTRRRTLKSGIGDENCEVSFVRSWQRTMRFGCACCTRVVSRLRCSEFPLRGSFPIELDPQLMPHAPSAMETCVQEPILSPAPSPQIWQEMTARKLENIVSKLHATELLIRGATDVSLLVTVCSYSI